MIYIASNVDLNYYEKTHNDWIFSTLKHCRDGQYPLLLEVDFEQEIENAISVVIPRSQLKYSNHINVPDRPGNYTCLESGEFVEFLDLHSHKFQEDDILILCDWDITMQRPLNNNEIELLNSLEKDEFALNLDKYPAFHLTDGTYWSKERSEKVGVSTNGYLGLCDIFNDVDPSWILYNCGVQAGKISAWRTVYEFWKNYLPTINEHMTHHGLYQGLFNYIIQKHMKVKLMPVDFHNAFWFPGAPIQEINNQLYANNSLVAFNHHKFQRKPNY